MFFWLPCGLFVVFPELMEQPSFVTELVEEVAQLTCIARGNPVPTITWFRDNEEILTNSLISITHFSGETVSSSILIFESLSVDVAGGYYCNASNFLAVAESVVSDTAVVTALCKLYFINLGSELQ